MSDSPGSPRHVSPLVRSNPESVQPASSPSSATAAAGGSSSHDLALASPLQPEAIKQDGFDPASDLSPLQRATPSHARPEPTFRRNSKHHPLLSSRSGKPEDFATVATTTTTTVSALRAAGTRPRARVSELPERDSIFAKHYFIGGGSNAGATRLPIAGRGAQWDHGYPQDVVASMLLPGPLSPRLRRASSVDSIDIEERSRTHSASNSPPYAAVASNLNKSPQTESKLSNELTQEMDLTTTPNKERMVEVGRSKIRRRRSEEQIQATIAHDEPVGFARSRKASHYHGLFKSEKSEKKEVKKSKEPAKDGQNVHTEELEDFSELDDRQRAADLGVETGIKSVSASHTQPGTLPTLPKHLAQSVLQGSALDHSDQEMTGEPAQEGEEEEEGQSVEWHSVGAPVGAYPIRLLEEIRAHPNTAQRQAEKSSDRVTSQNRRPPLSSESSEMKTTTLNTSTEKPLIVPSSGNKKEAGEGGEEEEDYSDKEHISAATYYPHQAPSPEDLDKGQEQTGASFSSGLGEPAVSLDAGLDGVAAGSVVRVRASSVTTAQPADKRRQNERDIGREAVAGTLSQKTEAALSSASGSEAEADEVEDLRSDVDDDDLADVETTPTNTPHLGPALRKRTVKAPLGAVELKPYKHQVGGHTKVFSFSKQAICKELNNKENAFYEVIERRHPELLEFMPRYLGVLNVTYTKAKRKRQPNGEQADKVAAGTEAAEAAEKEQERKKKEEEAKGHERVISHSMNSGNNEETVAQVIYANNMHIIPSNLFGRYPGINGVHGTGGRPQTAPSNGNSSDLISRLKNGPECKSNGRPNSQRQFPSWGATTVNQRLKEKVLRDVFSPPVIHHKHPRRSVRGAFALHNAESSGEATQANGVAQQQQQQNQHHSQPLAGRTESERGFSAAFLKANSDLTPQRKLEAEQRGGSAPLHDSAFSKYKEMSATVSIGDAEGQEDGVPTERHVTRRRSDQGLQRTGCDVDTSQRSELQYFENDEPRSDVDGEMFAMDLQNGPHSPSSVHSAGAVPAESTREGLRVEDAVDARRSASDSAIPDDQAVTAATDKAEGIEVKLASPTLSPEPALVPSNPLEAQLQPDERVRHFLLLEDLTAGMSKPCVLDLKMGTRQYGIEASQKKKDSQRLKCKMTTSRQLGVRVCGMQRWDVKTQQPVFEDKYAGRDLRAGREFQSALRRWLHDGVSNASVARHIPVLLDKLSRLEQIIRNLPRYRFYASSLLMIYDAADLPSQKSIDRGGQVDADTGDVDGEDGEQRQQRQQMASASTIDIKLIDFANCVTSQTKRLADAPCPPHHPSNPDRGYIRGLRSLRSYLQRIWSEINADEAESWMDRGDITQKSSGRTEHPEGWRKAGEGQDDGEVSE